jgi:hypothetical protein
MVGDGGGRGPQREFTQAEIEFFCAPGDKKFEKFALIKDLRLQLLSSPLQLEGKAATERTLDEAVASGTIANEVPPSPHPPHTHTPFPPPTPPPPTPHFPPPHPHPGWLH